ncbi:MAG: TetR/AcrR family transcriptional regulator [Saprospiraceae bacterium]|nr:TetR/AcrR family transcriptional regulator [Saprospiraceae bacterium]
MKKTQKKILSKAIPLFNRKGVSNVRLQDIAQEAGISPGNLSYHYPLKKDLMAGVLQLMEEQLKEASTSSLAIAKQDDYLTVIKDYLKFQIGNRFFYRDILEVIALVPESKQVFETQMQHVQSFAKNGLYLAVGKGLVLPEPHDGHYEIFARNIWGILNSWLAEREALGKEKVSLSDVMLAVWEFHYPYLTEKGQSLFISLRNSYLRL